MNDKKRIFYIAATSSELSPNRSYSNFVFALCKKAIKEGLSGEFDVNEIIPHYESTGSNIKKSLFNKLSAYDIFVVFLNSADKHFNPNVWFELGAISTRRNCKIIAIADDGIHIPFDINDVKIISLGNLKGFWNKYAFANGKIVKISDYSKNSKSLNYVKWKIEDIKGLSPEEVNAYEMFKNEFCNCLKDKEYENPFINYYENAVLNDMGYNSFREFLEDKVIDIATYIQGEQDAFEALTEAIKTTKEELRTTRFANQSIVSKIDNEKIEVAKAHNDFTDELNNISNNNNLSICRRIICNNNAQKWNDIFEALDKGNMTVYIRKKNYNINFELVVIDRKTAFIHFYLTNQSGDTDSSMESEVRLDSKIQRIKSTLRIRGSDVCGALIEVFDRLVYRNVKDGDLSRTLLGIEQNSYIKGKTKGGYFISPSHSLDDRTRRNKIDEMLIKAYKEWDLEEEDKVIMTVGLVNVLKYDLSNLGITNEQYNNILNKYKKIMQYDDKIILLDKADSK